MFSPTDNESFTSSEEGSRFIGCADVKPKVPVAALAAASAALADNIGATVADTMGVPAAVGVTAATATAATGTVTGAVDTATGAAAAGAVSAGRGVVRAFKPPSAGVAMVMSFNSLASSADSAARCASMPCYTSHQHNIPAPYFNTPIKRRNIPTLLLSSYMTLHELHDTPDSAE